MASFPALKTGVVAQYPLDRQKEYSTQVLRFLDGSEQRFPACGAALRRWVIRLDLLDEGELASLGAFFEAQGGRAGVFSFTDPFDAAVYANCSFDADAFQATYGGPQEGQASVTIKENRS